MRDLTEYLVDLHDLDEVRTRAKDLREQALRSLKRIDSIDNNIVIANRFPAEQRQNNFVETWVCSGNDTEVALLVKVQNHRNYSQQEDYNETASASENLTRRLKFIDLAKLLPGDDKDDVPVYWPRSLMA